jgi:integrase
MYTGQRLKDCVLIQWQNINLERQRIWVKQFKTGKEVSLPMAPKLYDVLLDAQAWRTDAYVCPHVAARYKHTDKRGKCIGDGLVNIDVMRVIRWIGVETSVAVEGRKKKTTVLGFHSLRHSFASFCAERGVPKAVVVSILGADSEIIDQFYTHVGEDAQQAAIEAISGSQKSTSEEKIRRSLEYIASLSLPPEELLTVAKILRE